MKASSASGIVRCPRRSGSSSSSVASQTKRSVSRASSTSASLGPESPEYASERVPFCDPEAVRLEPVVRHADREELQADDLERFAVGELAESEDALEHVLEAAEPHREIGELGPASGRCDQLRPLGNGTGPGQRAPHPRNEVAPVVEVEMRDRDRVHVRPFVPEPEPAEHAWTAVEQQPSAAFGLDEVPRLRAPGIGPGG